jgi:hypothetical protein
VVFVIGLAAAALLGVGWVLQQRATAGSHGAELLSWRLLRELIGNWTWWGGIAAVAAGQSMSAWALQFGPVTLVEPLLASCLLFAFGVSAFTARRWLRWQELLGSLVLAGALAAFLAVADPQADNHDTPTGLAITLAVALIAAFGVGLLLAGKTLGRRRLAVECVLVAAAAGAMYGLQDAATRGAIVSISHTRLAGLLATAWPYVVLAAATAGVLLSQGAFRAGRLDFALPPTAAAQAIGGIVLGVALLGDQLSATGTGLATEVISLLALIAGAVLIARAPSFG